MTSSEIYQPSYRPIFYKITPIHEPQCSHSTLQHKAIKFNLAFKYAVLLACIIG